MTVPRSPAEARSSHLESAAWRQVLIWGLRHIPVPLQQASMPLWSSFFYLQVPRLRRALELNQRQLLGLRAPRLQAMAFRTFTNYCRCVANAYRVHAGETMVPSEVPDLQPLRQALASGSGAVLATGHVGNWHLGPYYLEQHGLPPLTVVMSEEPDPRTQAIDASLRDHRMRVVYASRTPLLSLELRAALGRGELVGLQMDRPGAGGLRVPCAGGMATFSLGPALLARTCGVPVVPVFFPLTSRGVRIHLEPPLYAEHTARRDEDLARLTERLAAIYANVIRSYPDQWFTFFDFWGDRDGCPA